MGLESAGHPGEEIVEHTGGALIGQDDAGSNESADQLEETSGQENLISEEDGCRAVETASSELPH